MTSRLEWIGDYIMDNREPMSVKPVRELVWYDRFINGGSGAGETSRTGEYDA